ncbi:hypothetical protein ACN469_14875 [Corallococcus terminator]
MSRRISLLSLLAVALLMACTDPVVQNGPDEPPAPEVPVDPSRTRILATFDDGQPAADVAVLLNGAKAGQTHADGLLDLEVPTGPFELELRFTTEDGSFSRVAQSLEKGAEAQEVAVSLPRPVRILAPLEVTTSLVHLKWERSGDRNFREYKVYARQHFSAVDETNSELVHVGTEASTTDFRLTGLMMGGSAFVSADVDLYFRVFVLKDDGSLAGSNTLHVRTPRWANEHNFTRHYTLATEFNFAGAKPIHGVAYDGGALWFLYREEAGGFYDNDKLTLVQRDPETLAVLKELQFEDFRRPSGLTWDGTSLWVYFEGGASGSLARFNPTTGAREQEFVASQTTASLGWTGSHLLLTHPARGEGIDRVSPLAGGSAGSLPNPFTQRTSTRPTGVAWRPGEIWLSDMYASGLAIIDDAGTHIGAVNSVVPNFHHLAFMEGKLVGVTLNSQVYIMNIQP